MITITLEKRQKIRLELLMSSYLTHVSYKGQRNSHSSEKKKKL